MQDPTVAVVGATGLVGELLLRLLEERNFPVEQLRPMASARSVGQVIQFAGQEWRVEEATTDSFAGVDLVFFAATGALSKTLAPAAVSAGATVIDKSSTWRMTDGVALVVPEINAKRLSTLPEIVACPNCSTIGVAQVLAPLHDQFGLNDVIITTMQAASGAGREGNEELTAQRHALARGEKIAQPSVFSRRLEDNVIPHCDAFDEAGYTGEERKLEGETRKILDLPDLLITATCVRVPVHTGHSASMLVELNSAFDISSVREALNAHPGVRVMDDPGEQEFPTPLDVQDSDEVLVGRIRRDPHHERRIWLWQVSNNVRKGAATNAIQIAEAWLVNSAKAKS